MIYICDWCKKEFEEKPYRRVYSHKFCSLSCSISWNNKKRARGKVVNCENCGKEIYRIPSYIERNSHHFCSKDCEFEWKRGENHPRYHGGYDSKYGRGWKRQRNLAIERDKICKNCGTSENLDVHHIIPFKISKDNSLSNLIVLCKSCHSSIGNTYWKLENRAKYFEKINSMRLSFG